MLNKLFVLGQSSSASGEGGGGIGSIINGLTSELNAEAFLTLSGIAVFFLLCSAIYGMAMGSDDGPRAKKRAIGILIWYVVALLSPQIIAFFKQIVSGQGGFSG